ncbi:TPA: N-acetylmuramoyl-L-alanine amidase [Clostridioides difficile]|uniref:N-acetylmuramoyl-L-alanine amidase n=1 Tax=Clostridioides difficile TaxID=1496 RepID=UPI000980139B|nr:N-acetylmuramoyl-L-alanine amidase [Clostridioides difficile]MCO8870470.1 N-acetylmuramoyl-L-alanine amidase [Clostridioides difficile]MCO8998760.1 N-acetylmuramoyl-L-alanine amidase [Clostridioides difficile]MCO9001874.1 N-acetylmuramoyl-L-alanine amidase [Clostridioides difficile]SJP81243.1 N-acetylmuramoyl-L-alanine amidase LytC precursor [Clostridioides difficile]HBG5893561.1 N-acetylmuramoyl-L-alanine amidase [Clostridioides difficile]
MRRNTKLLTTGILSMAIVAPTMAFATESNAMENNADLNINLEKKSIVLGSTSKVSVKFKEKPDADSITLKYKCYDMPLDTTLNYNQSTESYEGTINYNKDPEYLNVWELQGITINSKNNPKTLNKQELEKMGLNLKDYNVTQECIIEDITSRKDVNKYLRKTSAPITELTGSDRYETAVKISKEGWKNGSDKVVIINGDVSIDGIISTPLATTYNAPILLVEKNNVPNSVKSELKRLNPKDIIIIGDENAISKTTANQIKSTVNASQTRLNGSNRYETSLLIAKEIDKNHDVEKVYITNANGGEVDALTIAAKAGQDKQPIILTDKDSITDNTYKWLKSEDLQNAYFIGGPQMISTNVINKVNGITKDSVTNNRVYGADRHETNANVIKKFYTDDELEAVLVAKSDVLVDALAAGPLAANLKSPILITPKTYVSAYHKDNLEAKSANKVYKIGGGLTSKVMSSIASSLSKHNTTSTEPGNSGGKTVMIDPGHGGSAPGNSSGGMIEKDYNLNTSLATTEYLRSKGFNVIMTRDTDKTLSLGNRTALSNSLKPDLFTSIHYNGSTNKQGHGVEVFYKLKDKNGGTTKTVATNILNRILEKFKLTNRGIKTRVLPSDSTKDYLYVLRSNDMPAVLVECAFLDNENDMSLINSSAKVKEMGTQIGKGIEDSLK